MIEVTADAEIMQNAPTDITPYGTLKNIEPQVLILHSSYQFPVDTDKRKFQQKWLNEYVWLEYSVLKNACFCYACRQFSPTHERDNVFKHTGFSGMHLNSMAKWAESIERERTNTSVIEMASGSVLQYRRNYVKKVIEVCISIHEFLQHDFNIY